MTMKRSDIIELIDRITDYDASTVIIHRDGTISAILDADKTFAGPHKMRTLVCFIEDLPALPFTKKLVSTNYIEVSHSA